VGHAVEGSTRVDFLGNTSSTSVAIDPTRHSLMTTTKRLQDRQFCYLRSMQIYAERANDTCSACGEQQRVVAVTIGATTSRLERLAALEIARKAHRAGCEIWPKYRLCDCP
jgi:hypothetical protein